MNNVKGLSFVEMDTVPFGRGRYSEFLEKFMQSRLKYAEVFIEGDARPSYVACCLRAQIVKYNLPVRATSSNGRVFIENKAIDAPRVKL